MDRAKPAVAWRRKHPASPGTRSGQGCSLWPKVVPLLWANRGSEGAGVPWGADMHRQITSNWLAMLQDGGSSTAWGTIDGIRPQPPWRSGQVVASPFIPVVHRAYNPLLLFQIFSS